GACVENHDPPLLPVRSGTRQPRAVRADGNLAWSGGAWHLNPTKDMAVLVEQVEGHFSDPRRDAKSMARLSRGDKMPAFGADRHRLAFGRFQVRDAQAIGGQCRPEPEPVPGGDQEGDAFGRQRDYLRAVVEPAVQMSPFPIGA